MFSISNYNMYNAIFYLFFFLRLQSEQQLADELRLDQQIQWQLAADEQEAAGLRGDGTR